jgi:hypothetical protein
MGCSLQPSHKGVQTEQWQVTKEYCISITVFAKDVRDGEVLLGILVEGCEAKDENSERDTGVDYRYISYPVVDSSGNRSCISMGDRRIDRFSF